MISRCAGSRCDDEFSESSRDVDCSRISASTADSDIFLRPPTHSGAPPSAPPTPRLFTNQRQHRRLRHLSPPADALRSSALGPAHAAPVTARVARPRVRLGQPTLVVGAERRAGRRHEVRQFSAFFGSARASSLLGRQTALDNDIARPETTVYQLLTSTWTRI